MSNYVETDCTFTHEGHTFESGGAVATDDYLIAYPSDEVTNHGYALKDWHGRIIGSWHKVSSWPIQSWQGTRYYAMRARLTDGREYSLRGFGTGMIARGKRIKSSRA